jgi:transposase
MWTQEQRRIYRREGDGCPSDLRDVEWARLAPLIPPALPGGRPRTDMRAAMNAILYLLRTGCPWRYLPRDSFPPRSTVYNIFRKFPRDGVWEAIWAELHMALRSEGLREPRRNLGHLRYPRLYPAGPHAARQGVGCGPRYNVTKVGKSDCEGTFAEASGNDEDAPKAVAGTRIDLRNPKFDMASRSAAVPRLTREVPQRRRHGCRCCRVFARATAG